GETVTGTPAHREYDLSSQAKFLPETWKGTWALNLTQPWLGSGPGSFWVRYPAFRRPGVILLERKHNTETDHPENELLEQWTDGGIVGLLLWLWLFGALLRHGWARLRRPEQEAQLLGAFVAVAAGVLAMLFSSSSRYVVPGWLMYFSAGLLGVLCLRKADPRDPVLACPLPLPGAWRAALAVLVAAAAAAAGRAVVRGFTSDARLNYAIYYSKGGEWDKALQEYGRMVPWTPAYVMGQYFTGNVLKDRDGPGDLELALAQYRRVRELAPHYVQVHYQEGQVLRKLGRKEEAIARFEAQAALDPVWDQPWRQLAELYRETGRTEQAAEASRKLEQAQARWAAAAL
ncbi:MAG: O-antigen ligase family protein, partial [Elusimicrobia bacterium]|nr:O-antigen ligase family protein [Elusimicrobiota bacterium]